MFDLLRLRLLRELAHRGTMTAVGNAFRMTSSAVSQQLATLQREAGVALLERVGRRVRLTTEGARLAAHAEAILQAVDAAQQDLKTSGKKPRGVLELASFGTFAKGRLLPAVIRARERFPELRVVIHELEPADSIAAVRDGRCHMAVTFAYNLTPSPALTGLVSQPLMEERVLLALPRKWRSERDPVSLQRLARENWIVGSRQPDDRQLAERACAVAGFEPRITHTVDDYDLELRMISAGLGVGFVPELGLQFPSAESVEVRTACGPALSRRVHAVTRTALAGSPMVRAVLSELASTG
jgi:DNA-binding transcriptional LysR family regulator